MTGAGWTDRYIKGYKQMRIVETDLEIQREPFARPFAFKGSAFHEKWNLVVRLKDADG